MSNSSQMKVTKMLLIVSTVFVLLNLPDYVLRIQFLIVSRNSVAQHSHKIMNRQMLGSHAELFIIILTFLS